MSDKSTENYESRTNESGWDRYDTHKYIHIYIYTCSSGQQSTAIFTENAMSVAKPLPKQLRSHFVAVMVTAVSFRC